MAPSQFFSTLASLGLLFSGASANKNYRWPDAKIDVLEHMLYEHSGYKVNSPATFVIPCGAVSFGIGRSGPAEWIRTAYHDMATADVTKGTGGIDASIGYELDRDENVGKGFNETLFNLREYFTERSSMADLIAMGAVFSVAGCSDAGVLIPFRGGRIDARGPGPKGVPKPEETLETHIDQFKRQGFNKEEMIGLIACGHTLGGVHGVDFPEIVDVVNDPAEDDNTQMFDTTIEGSHAFDNKVAVEFVGKIPQNPLAFGHNVTTNSDARVFNSDGGKVINKMAASNPYFLATCKTLMERMIDTVPKEVKLTEPILPIAAKPTALFATINSNGTMTVTGQIRLRAKSLDQDPNRKVKIFFRPQNGADCTQSKSKSCISVDATPFFHSFSRWGGANYPIFQKYAFSAEIPLTNRISGFDVMVTDTLDGKSNSTTYKNGGSGFPFDTSISAQPLLSCSEQTYHGAFNLSVAIRDDLKMDRLKMVLHTPEPLDSLTPVIGHTSLEMTKVGPIPGSKHTLYKVAHIAKIGQYTRIYDLIASNQTHTIKRMYNEIYMIPQCPHEWAPGVAAK